MSKKKTEEGQWIEGIDLLRLIYVLGAIAAGDVAESPIKPTIEQRVSMLIALWYMANLALQMDIPDDERKRIPELLERIKRALYAEDVGPVVH